MLRFAPSPTGDMHIGNLRVALINYIVAKQRGEKLLLRIEDTDQKRNVEGKEAELKLLLEKFGLHFDEELVQSSRSHLHRRLAEELVAQEKAFVCFCDEEELEAQRQEAKEQKRPYRYSGKCLRLDKKEIESLKESQKPYSIRIKKPAAPIFFDDIIKGRISADPYEVDHFVILRSNGMPTYNFACACDDMLFDVTLVIRGEDHLSNTPKQLHVRAMLGDEHQSLYAHLPIILNEEGKKMSKRDKASSVIWLLKEGFIPDAIINYLLLLGNAAAPKEIFTLPEAIELFDLTKLSRSSAKFDIDKLRFINREHLRRMHDKRLSTLFGFADADIGKLAKLYLEEASTLNELERKIKTIFSPKEPLGEFAEEMKQIKEVLKTAPHFEEFNDLKDYIIDKTGLKGKRLFKPLRLLITGSEHGPELSDIYGYIRHYLLEVTQ